MAYTTTAGEEVGRSRANELANLKIQTEFDRLTALGLHKQAYDLIKRGFIEAPVQVASADPAASSGPSSISPEIQGLLDAARRAQEEAAQADVGHYRDGSGNAPGDEDFNRGNFPEKNIYDDYTYEDLSPLVTEKGGTVGQLQEDYRRRQALEKEIPGLFSNTFKGLLGSGVSGNPGGVIIGGVKDIYNAASGKYDAQRKELAELQAKVLQRTAMGNLQAGPDITGYNTDVLAPTSYTGSTGSIGSIGDMDPMSQSLLDAEYANRFGFGSPTNQYGSVGGGLISDPIYTGGQYGYGAGVGIPGSATFDSTVSIPESNRADYNADFINTGLLHPDALTGGLVSLSGAQGSPGILERQQAANAAAAAHVAAVNAANIASGYETHPDDQERERTNEERIRSSEEADPRNEMQW